MRKVTLPVTIAAALSLAGCAGYGLGGSEYGYGSDYGYGYNGSDDFERAALNACGREASRYGRVSINSVNQETRDRVVVTGNIAVRDRNRDQFGCTFDRDGRISDFRRF